MAKMASEMQKQLKWFAEDTKKEMALSDQIKKFWESGGSRFKIPPMPKYDGKDWSISTFDVTKNSAGYIREMIHGRYIAPETYTQLVYKKEGVIMMSDTPAEIFDHMPAFDHAQKLEAKTALVVGLGIGMVVRMLAKVPTMRHIDVMEISGELIEVVAPTLTNLDGNVRVKIHYADVFKHRWPPVMALGLPGHKYWDIIWFDIWPSICEDNLPEMNKLERRYKHHCKWSGSWGRSEIMRRRAHNRAWKVRTRKET